MARGGDPIEDGDLIFTKFTPELMKKPVANVSTGCSQPAFLDMLESASTLGGFNVLFWIFKVTENFNLSVFRFFSIFRRPWNALIASCTPHICWPARNHTWSFAGLKMPPQLPLSPMLSTHWLEKSSRFLDAFEILPVRFFSRQSVFSRWTGQTEEPQKELPINVKSAKAKCRTPLFDNTRHGFFLIIKFLIQMSLYLKACEPLSAICPEAINLNMRLLPTRGREFLSLMFVFFFNFRGGNLKI